MSGSRKFRQCVCVGGGGVQSFDNIDSFSSFKCRGKRRSVSIFLRKPICSRQTRLPLADR